MVEPGPSISEDQLGGAKLGGAKVCSDMFRSIRQRVGGQLHQTPGPGAAPARQQAVRCQVHLLHDPQQLTDVSNGIKAGQATRLEDAEGHLARAESYPTPSLTRTHVSHVNMDLGGWA